MAYQSCTNCGKRMVRLEQRGATSYYICPACSNWCGVNNNLVSPMIPGDVVANAFRRGIVDKNKKYIP